ncbi:MAG: hypothetical protein IPO32_13910 [Crocinitomicaceae bacterium]|nr:hypothetical protein [Crocinitomicaceae bacterium]
MKKNTFLIFTSAILLASCGGTSGDTNGVTNEANGVRVGWENVLAGSFRMKKYSPINLWLEKRLRLFRILFLL